MKKILLLFLLFCTTTTLLAQTFTAGGINYNITSATTVEVGLNPTASGSIVIPATVTDAATAISYAVKRIGNDAFRNCTSLTTVTFPNSITLIGDRALRDCGGLTSVIIPDSVLSIGSQAFYNCSVLEVVTIPNTVTTIREQAFNGCQALTSLTIGNSVETIEYRAFRRCTSLTSLNIPSSVTRLEQEVFALCTSLSSVTVNWATPLNIQANVFLSVNLANVTLNVPAGTVAAYDTVTDNVWTNFGSIVAAPSPATHLNFDGVDDYVVLPLNSTRIPTSNFTHEFWFKTTDLNGTMFTASTGTLGNPSGWDRSIYMDNGKVSTHLWTGFDNKLTTPLSYNDGNWHHVAHVVDASGSKLYLDGTLAASNAVVASVFTTNTEVTLGVSPLAGGSYFSGDIDDVRVWNVARSANDIARAKNCELASNEAGLLAYYKFNQGTDQGTNTAVTSLLDATANANHGTLNAGFALTGANSNFLAGSVVTTGSTIPAAPTATAQSFCTAAIASSLVPAMSATVKWYATATSTTALLATDVLATGTYYVAALNANACESARTSVAITITTTPTPTVTAPTSITVNITGDCNFFAGTYIESGLYLGKKFFNKNNQQTTQIAFDGQKWVMFIDANISVYLYSNTTVLSGLYPPTTGWIANSVHRCSGTMTITVPPAPATFCAGATVANLTATGTDLKWYSTETGGTALATTTALATGTYYVSQTLNGCESARTALAVTVTPNETPTFTAVSPICSGATLLALPTTSNNGIIGTWSPALNNSATTTYTFTPSVGQCGTTATLEIIVNDLPLAPAISIQSLNMPATLANFNPPPSDTIRWYDGPIGGSPLTANTVVNPNSTYYVTALNLNNCESLRTPVSVSIIPTFIAVAPICSGESLAALPTTSIDGITGTWSPALNNTSTTEYTFTPDNVGMLITYATLKIVVNPLPTSPAASAQTFTTASTVANLVPAPSTTIKWYNVATGGTALTTTTAIATGNYYVSETNTNGCESARTTVAVTVNLVALPFVGQTFTAGGINYIVTKATLPYEVAVHTHTNFVGAANIPASVSNAGYSFAVKSIGFEAFYYCTGLTSVTIPNSVTSIGNDAFNSCIGLTSVTIPNSITTIGNGAFRYCPGLTSVTIGNSVTTIGFNAFFDCNGLTSLTIPNSVTSIGSSAFYFCTRLTSVMIGASVTSIGAVAFGACGSLTSVTVNWATPITIDPNVFQHVTLANVTLNVPTGTRAAYQGVAVWQNFNPIVEPVVLPFVGQTFTAGGINYIVTKDTAPYEVAVHTHTAFTGAANIPASVSNAGFSFGVTSIGASAFSSCTGLTTVSIPNSVTSIGNTAFRSCTGLTSVTIPDSVTSIGNSAFQNCSTLDSVILGNSVTSIGDSTFNRCSALSSISIGTSVTSIGVYAFAQCTSLTSVTIPNSVITIRDGAFRWCGLTTITIPNSVTTIETTAFLQCTALTSATIGNSVTSIGAATFLGCTALTTVIIPNSVTSFGDDAFRDCTRLTAVSVNWATPLAINPNVFQNVTLANVTLNVPTGTRTAYQAAAVWQNFNPIVEPVVLPFIGQTFTAGGINYIVTKATLPYEVAVHTHTAFTGAANIPASVSNDGFSFGVTSIGADAFQVNGLLTSVTIPNTVKSIGNEAFFATNLTSVTIPNSVTSIGRTAFGSNPSLISVIIPNSVVSIGDNAFSSCELLTSVIIPNSVTSMGTGAFEACFSLTSVTLPNSITSIGANTFRSCSRLTTINIPSTVTTIGQRAFMDCTRLLSVTLNRITPIAINANVFQNVIVANVTLNVPTGTRAAYQAAAVWQNFNPIVEPVTLPVVGDTFTVNGVVYKVTKATTPYEVAVGDNGVIPVPKIGYNTNGKQATVISGAVNIPETVINSTYTYTVTSISVNAFSNNSGITSVTIPATVVSIGADAFRACFGLTEVTVNWTTPIAIVPNVFSGLDLSTIKLNVPIGSEAQYISVDVWKNFKTNALGTDGFGKNATLKLYPNPVQAEINFNQEVTNLEVLDMTGKKVQSFQKPSTTFDVTGLAKGIYIIKGKTSEGKTINEKMVKE